MKKKTILLKVIEEETFKFEVDDEKLSQIMNMLGSPVAVKTSQPEKNVSVPSPPVKPEEISPVGKRAKYKYDDSQIKQMLSQGMSISKIAAACNIPAQSMRNYIIKNKLHWDAEKSSESTEED